MIRGQSTANRLMMEYKNHVPTTNQPTHSFSTAIFSYISGFSSFPGLRSSGMFPDCSFDWWCNTSRNRCLLLLPKFMSTLFLESLLL